MNLLCLVIDGERLRLARTHIGLTQGQVAEKVGLKKAAISAMESGRAVPSGNVLARLCRLYGVDVLSLTRTAVVEYRR